MRFTIFTLESTADAVSAGQPVRAEGTGSVESAGPPAAPQAPDDASFTAADLRLTPGAADPKIEIYMDGDNLESVSGSSAVLRVLGLSIQVNDRTSLVDDNGRW